MTFQGSAATHPPVGMVVDDGMLKLVEVLGIGGYGVCYKAFDYTSFPPRTVAVKCLILSQPQSSRQHQLHLKEVMLHQLASAHPGVVSLRRIIREGTHTYIVMDFAPDGDLFSQILNHKRYLGNDALIKHVFLQLLDAVEYCHRLGIYHRDLKPENVLCFDGGYTVAITDFGLATTDKMSAEFRTGSIYHMSPECHGSDFTLSGPYSPLHNDVWSLAVVLLNLTTGRNPWKSATMSDPTFQAYVEDPLNFLPSVLPISHEMNSLLIHMLALDWQDRPSIAEVRACFETIDNFYAPGAIFEGSMARCPWEARLDEAEVAASDLEQEPPVSVVSKVAATTADAASRWSEDSGLTSDLEIVRPLEDVEAQYPDEDDDDLSPQAHQDDMDADLDDGYNSPPMPGFTHSVSSTSSSIVTPPLPATPDSTKTSFRNPAVHIRKNLMIDTRCGRMHSDLEDVDSLRSSLMQTAKGSPTCSFTSSSLIGLVPSDSGSYYSDTEEFISPPIGEDTASVDFMCDSPVSPPSIRWSRFGIVDDDQPSDDSTHSYTNPTSCNVAPLQTSTTNAPFNMFMHEKGQTGVQADYAKISAAAQCKPQERSVRRKSIFLRSPLTWFSGSRFFSAVEAV